MYYCVQWKILNVKSYNHLEDDTFINNCSLNLVLTGSSQLFYNFISKSRLDFQNFENHFHQKFLAIVLLITIVLMIQTLMTFLSTGLRKSLCHVLT